MTTGTQQQGQQQGQADRAMYQEVRVTLADGRVLKYVGPRQVTDETADILRIVEIEFSQPMPLPPGMTWDTLSANGRQPVVSDEPPDHGLDSDA